ncbi:MAG: acetyl-CoA synthetase [Ruminococcaceae bacterium]|nr:acetyl-CoA synthetase [Oscillospiraceae bacterium]
MLSRFLPRVEFDSYEDFITNYQLNIPENFNFGYDIVDEWARIEPEKQALVWCNDELAVKRFTFTDVKRMSDKAASLFASLGLKKGDRVMLILKQRPEVWFSMVGLFKLGAVCIPASFQLTPKDIVYRCNMADVKMVLSVNEPEILKHIQGSMADCPTVRHWGLLGGETPEGFFDYGAALDAASEEWVRPTGDAATTNSDPMLTYFTSGTSGMPKMVLHDYTHPLGHIVTAKYWQQVENNGIHLTQSDSGWAKFGWGKIFGQWICGSAIGAYDTEKFSPSGMLAMLRVIRPTTFCAPPTIYRFMIKENLTREDFASVKHACIAGEPLNPEVFYRFRDLTGLELRDGFGQTEGSVMLANFKWLEIKPGSAGRPAPLYHLDIVDRNGKSCEEGIVGSIVARDVDKHHPTGLFRCYYKDEAATAKSFVNGMYFTGDMAWRDEDGYFWFTGRDDDVIKCSGYRIGPFEVESALMEHPSVLECAVTAAPDPVRGQVVKATIVLARGYSPSEELKKELQNHVKKVTAPYKYPRIVEFVEELPKTTSGKIRRVEIRQRDQEGTSN